MSRIFISYKRVDKDKVFKIKDQIESALGEKCWIDLDGIESDAVFKRVIIKAINECEIVLFMYSKAHCKIVDFEKDWTVRELNYAAVRNKRIVFVNLDASKLTDEFVFDYGMKQQIDGKSKESVCHLISDLRGWRKVIAIKERQNDSLIEKRQYHFPRLKKLLCKYSKKRIFSAFVPLLIALTIIISFYLSKTSCVQVEESQCISQLDSVQTSCFELAIPFADYDDTYGAVSSFHEGLARIRRNGKDGYIDKLGNEVIPCQFEDAFDFNFQRACVIQNGKYGFIDKNGEVVIDCQYDYASNFSEGLAVVQKKEKYGYIDISGKAIIPCAYQYAFDFSEGFAKVRRNEKYGYIDKLGTEVIPCIYGGRSLGPFSEGFARVRFADKDGGGFIDKTGNVVILESLYDIIGDFHEGLAYIVETNELGERKYGFIDTEGHIAIPCVYDDVDSFSEGLAYVEKDDCAAFINKLGQEVISLKPVVNEPFVFFHEGFAVVKKEGKYGYINKAGEDATPFIYDEAYPVSEGYALVKLHGQYGYLRVVR